MNAKYYIRTVATFNPRSAMAADVIQEVSGLQGLTIQDDDKLLEFRKFLETMVADVHAQHPKNKSCEVSSCYDSSRGEHIYTISIGGNQENRICIISIGKIKGEWKGGIA